MKKTVIILFIIILLVVGALFAIPIFFKQNLLEVTKNTLNKQLNAEVQFSDLTLSLFRDFPRATVELKDVLIKGKNEFQNDTLLSVNEVRTKMNLASLFRKSDMSIEEIVLDRPQLNLIVNETGLANWELTDPQKIENISTENTTVQKNTFQLHLNKIEIKNAELVYDDQPAKVFLELDDMDFDISGKMYGNSTQLQTDGTVENFVLRYDAVNYISNTTLKLATLLDVDYENMIITIADNELMVNRLPLELSGNIEVPSDTTIFDLKLKTKESDFENFLALVPPVYEEYLKDIQTEGTAAISGTVKGFYFGDSYPALSLQLDVSDGNFHYADLPEEIKNIKADISIVKPQGSLDLTKIEAREAHAEIRNNPVDLNLVITQPVSDPYFDGTFIGMVNLDHLKDALPLDSVNISGIIDANLFVKGNYSDIENEAYHKIKSDGIVMLDNLVYDSRELTQKVYVPKGQLDFSPKSVNLQEFKMKVGQSDFNFTGQITNYLNYLFNEGTLKGNLQMNSGLVNLNELLRLQVKPQNTSENEQIPEASMASQPDETEEILAFDIPENIDITFQSNIENAIFDRLQITSINGLIRAIDKQLILNGLSMKMLEGELKMNGSYKNTALNQPFFDFGFDINSFDIPLMYKTLSGIRQILPVAGKSYGKFSSTMKMEGRLSPQLKLIAPTANGKGMFGTNNLQIVDSRTFDQLKGIIREEKLKNVTIDDFMASFNVENGDLLLNPFKTKVIGQETTVSGNLNTESLLDMRLDFKVQREVIGPDIQNILAVIPGNKNIKIVPAGVLIKGPVGEPKVSMDLSETKKAITDATKDDLKKSLEKLGKGLKKLFK
ncbi:MAG: AsmA family protein [Bacteroidota bacterium]